jgi:2,4-dienoyl-CoA reductase-like NADH-dependent reductase (Old Yellow Enzyme family)
MSERLPLLFQPLRLRGVEVANRIAMSSMSMYSCLDGMAGNWHLVHLGSRAIGGAGMVAAECTAITREGRITPGDLGLWSDAHTEALRPITSFISEHGAVPAIQLSHAGRKGGRPVPWISREPLPEAEWGSLLAPSPIAFAEGSQVPREASEADIEQLVEDFAAAAVRAVEAGFKVVEIHAAHGFILHQFLSPIANRRTDRFGGALAGRASVLRMVARAVRAAIPEEIPLFVRLTIRDWLDGGITPEDTEQTMTWLREDGVDLIDCSSGAIAPGEQLPLAPGYHAPFTKTLRSATGMKVGVVGLITEPEQAEALLQDGAADMIFVARQMLRDPYWPMRAASALGVEAEKSVPVQYRRSIATPGKFTQW